jgi:hypothetical protein
LVWNILQNLVGREFADVLLRSVEGLDVDLLARAGCLAAVLWLGLFNFLE